MKKITSENTLKTSKSLQNRNNSSTKPSTSISIVNTKIKAKIPQEEKKI